MLLRSKDFGLALRILAELLLEKGRRMRKETKDVSSCLVHFSLILAFNVLNIPDMHIDSFVLSHAAFKFSLILSSIPQLA